MSSADEWELSKENVLPLRQGRDFSSLTAGLQPQDSDVSRIREEKQAFEAEIRTYSGDDPLDVWYRYIKWAEQTFPKGGKMSLSTIIENCVTEFTGVEKYRNDERYIYVWTQLAEICRTPLDIYNYLYDQNIGCELSSFYVSWASVLEQCGNTKKADAIYLKGLDFNARPYEYLKKKHREFQTRVARGLMNQSPVDQAPDTDEQMMPENNDTEQRQVLSQLRAIGKKHVAPSNRTGSHVKGSAGTYGSVIPRQNKKDIHIHCDENQVPGNLQAQTGEWASIPKASVTNRENEKKASKWTKAKISQPSVNVPLSDVNSFRQPSFSVHVEEEAQVMRTPAKTQEVGNQVLSSRKPEKLSSYNPYQMKADGGQDENQKPRYCKHKIYCGAEEYSFEELRSVRWFKKEEQKKREEEHARAIEECRLQLEREKQLLQEEQEKARQQRLQLQQEQMTLMDEARQRIQQEREQFEREAQLQLQQQRRWLNQAIQVRMQEQDIQAARILPEAMASTSSALGSVFANDAHGNTENISPDMLAQLQAHHPTNTSKVVSNQRPSGMVLPSGENRQSENSSNNSSVNTPSTGDLLHKTLSGGASPTVFTKEAMGLVRGMFNVSLDGDRRAEDISMAEPSQPSRPPPQQATVGNSAAGCPFVIFDETENEKPAAISSVPFKVLEDQENLPNTVTESRKVGLTSGSVSVSSRSLGTKQDSMIYEAPVNFKPFEDEEMDCFESHAREDITTAPVGSSLSFAAAARLASTPFRDNNVLSTSVNMDDFETENVEISAPEPAVLAQPAVSDLKLDANGSVLPDTSGESNSFKKNLSPIMEGSSEDSDSHAKSHHLTGFSSALQAVPGNLETVMDQTEDTSCLLQGHSFGNQSTHVIDTTTYIPEIDERTENLLSTSICIDPKNPFDETTIARFLNQLSRPLYTFDNYSETDQVMPEFGIDSCIALGDQAYQIVEKIGEGGFAKVYLAEISDLFYGRTCVLQESKNRALKVQQPAAQWEFYISRQIHEKLQTLKDPVDVRPAVMEILEGVFFTDGSCMVTHYHDKGTLLDLANTWKQLSVRIQQQEAVQAYMTIELLHLVENLHKCQIIHGDIKPDNFLVLSFPKLPVSEDPQEVFKGNKRFSQLIDFGQSIDMSLYPPHTTFLAKVNTQCFQCIEMKTDRPWTYQVDLFGLAGTIHVLLFSQYMKVYQEGGLWHMTSRFPRDWNSELWRELFRSLLNVPSCSEIPDLSALRKKFEKYFVQNLLNKYNSKCQELNQILRA